MSGNWTKGQSALEFFITYAWQLLVIAVVIAAFVVFIELSGHVVPQSCTFALQLTCKGIEVGSNSVATVINLEAVNGQQYILANPSAYINISQYGSVNTTCIPSNVTQGADILCSAVLPVSIPSARQVRGTMIVNAIACLSGTFGNCMAQQGETYIGNFSTSVNQYTGNFPVTLALYVPSNQVPLNEPEQVTASVRVLGQSEAGVSVVFTTNSEYATISPHFALTDASGNATGFITVSRVGSVDVTANVFGISTSNAISVGYYAT